MLSSLIVFILAAIVAAIYTITMIGLDTKASMTVFDDRVSYTRTPASWFTRIVAVTMLPGLVVLSIILWLGMTVGYLLFGRGSDFTIWSCFWEPLKALWYIPVYGINYGVDSDFWS